MKEERLAVFTTSSFSLVDRHVPVAAVQTFLLPEDVYADVDGRQRRRANHAKRVHKVAGLEVY